MTTRTVLAEKIFEIQDQVAFAAISSDHNPLHMDESFARRTQAGALVVHGVHTLLWAANILARQANGMPFAGVRCRFHQPLFVGDRASLILLSQTSDRVQVEIVASGVRTATISIVREAQAQRPAEMPENLPILRPGTPADPSLEDMAGMRGRAAPAPGIDDGSRLFPDLTNLIGPARLTGLLATSQIVGMICPGLNSLYAGLDISLNGPDDEGVAFFVRKLDRRFRLLGMDVLGSGIAGTIEAFARLPVQRQDIDAIAQQVPPGVFQDHEVLIIGGSRGLGELTAKVIALGGGRPLITYYREDGEARRVVREIREAGGDCEIFQYDVTRPADDQLALVGSQIEYCYYFATSKIFLRKSELYNSSIFENFKSYYLDGLYDLCEVLARRSDAPLKVFYPSTVAIEQGVGTIAEYAMAKAAGEVLCDYMNSFMDGVEVTRERLPRTLTDQTATVGVSTAANALDVMLPLIYRLHGVAPIMRAASPALETGTL